MSFLTGKIASIIGAAMGAGLIALAILLAIQKGETRHFQKLYAAEQSAHALTVANYRKAAAEAEAADLAHARKVEAHYAEIAKEQSDDLRQKLDTALARAADYARRLRVTSATHPSSSAIPDLPGTSRTPGDPAGASEAAFMADTLICAEAVVKAEGWQGWWTKIEGNR